MYEIPMLILFILITVVAGAYIGLVCRGIDRKIAAYSQSRIGPPLRQPFWDLKKLMLKQTIIPENAVKWIFAGAPLLALASSVLLLIYIWIPYFLYLTGMGNTFFMKSGDLILIIYLLMVPAIALIAGGFASGSPLSTIGAQREMVILMATELPIAVTIVAVAWRMKFLAKGWEPFALGTVSAHPFWGGMGPVGIIGGILLLLAFLTVIPAEVAKIPFDQAEAETEIADGLVAEYSGKHFAFFQLAETIKAVAVTSLVVVIFSPYGFTSLTGYKLLIGSMNVTIIADIVFFLIKMLVVYSLSITFVRVSMSRLKISQVSRFFILIVTVISLTGFLLIYLDPAILAM